MLGGYERSSTCFAPWKSNLTIPSVYSCLFLLYLYTISLSVGLILADDEGFRFARYYGNSMVLQGSPYQAVVWGFAAKIGDVVTLKIPDVVELNTKVEERGDYRVWIFTLPSITQPGPYDIIVNADSKIISLRDVLFGDVWVCSGQSNMEFSMAGVMKSSEAIQKVLQYREIRLFKAAKVQSFLPLYDLYEVAIPWTKPLADEVSRFSAVCLFYSMDVYDRLKRPLGLVDITAGGSTIETWSAPEPLTTCGSNLHLSTKRSDPLAFRVDESRVPTAHCTLWNAMVHPLLNMTIYGVIWYQGESNAGMARLYECAFRQLIKDWRQKFSRSNHQTNPMFPFGFVQVGAFREGNMISGFSALRWSQTQSIGYVPNARMRSVFMAVAMDLPDFHSPFGNIHPRHKQEVGSRLALSGLAVAYGLPDIRYQGPFPVQIARHSSSIQIDYGDESLDIRNISGFEVCCSETSLSDRACSDHDASWKPASIILQDRGNVLIDTSSCKVLPVTKVRYAWRESPCELRSCAVYGKLSDLPAPPFLLPFDYKVASVCESESETDNENSCYLH